MKNHLIALAAISASLSFVGCSGNPKAAYELVSQEYPGAIIENCSLSNQPSEASMSRFIVKDSKDEYWIVDTDSAGTTINWRKRYPEGINDFEINKMGSPAESIIVVFYADSKLVSKKVIKFRPPCIGESVIIGGNTSYKVEGVEWKWSFGNQNIPTVSVHLSAGFAKAEKEEK